ncbi:MAG: alanine racemase [Deltaproteobacteria bacterium]|nr:alanine racemase [Deltaproteobacteria bacterium]
MRKKQSREVYEKPTIVRTLLRAANKYAGHSFVSGAFAAVDGVPVRDLLKRYGSPLYAVSEKTLRRRIREFLRAFRSLHPQTVVAYSYKTNHLMGICAILRAEGAWAEVTSGFEYDLARRLGIPGRQIVFNGPYKEPEALRRAIREGARVNIDSLEEVFFLEETVPRSRPPLKVGVRVNMNLHYPPWDKFGFHLESGQAWEACQRIHASGRLKVAGLHIHAGTYLTDPGIYRQAMAGLVGLALQVEKFLDGRIEYLDLGGGYASANAPHSQILPGETTCPTFEQYAEGALAPLLGQMGRFRRKPLLILEPGRALVDESMVLLTTVVSTKRLGNGLKGVVVDAGVNLLPTSYYFRHELAAAENLELTSEEVNIYGPLCMQLDTLRLGVRLPPLQKGSVIVVKNVGAYNFAHSLQFIFPRPAVVLVKDGKTDLLFQAESGDDLLRLHRLPRHLAKCRPS